MWRIVTEKIATLEEIERSWSLEDLMRANAILDMKADLALAQMQKAKQESKGNR